MTTLILHTNADDKFKVFEAEVHFIFLFCQFAKKVDESALGFERRDFVFLRYLIIDDFGTLGDRNFRDIFVEGSPSISENESFVKARTTINVQRRKRSF